METSLYKTAFRQFNFCSLCKINHRKGKKHVYSMQHKVILKRIIEKFKKKIQTERARLFSPRVEPEDFEVGAKFWCYFCQEELSKHEVLERCTVVGAGLLEHIASKEHIANMEQFFWDNLLKKDIKAEYKISIEDLSIFKKAALLAVKKQQRAEQQMRAKIADHILEVERKRLSVTSDNAASVTDTRGTSVADMPGTSVMDIRGTRVADLPGTSSLWEPAQQKLTSQSTYERKKTMSAKADGLTCLQQAAVEGEGNVHSGATPPWLLPNTQEEQRMEIGPTMEDFKKHLEREKKAKLPACRVGAKFDHTGSTALDWLPSFGRVWSKGRRLQSRQHFERKLKKGMRLDQQNKPGSPETSVSMKPKQPGETTSSDQINSNVPSQEMSISQLKTVTPSQIAPYARKNTLSGAVKQAYHAVPYCKKRKLSLDSFDKYSSDKTAGGQYNSVSSGMSTNWQFTQPDKSHVHDEGMTTDVVPYQRQKSAVPQTSRQVRLIQTPLLGVEENK